jgi:transposase-like protein
MAKQRRGGQIKQKIDGEETRRDYFASWRQGKTYTQVAEEFGVTKQAVHQHVKRVLSEMREAFAGEVEDWRSEQISRILEMLDVAKERHARGGEDAASEGNLAAKLLNQLADITGTKAAQRHDININVSDLTDEELEALAKSKG